jgi:hypothetical protein
LGLLRSMWTASERLNRRGGRIARLSTRLNYECLESRRVLFAASVVNELPELPDWQGPVIANPAYAPALIDVSLEVRPSVPKIIGSAADRWSYVPLPKPAEGGGFHWPDVPRDGIPNSPPTEAYPEDSSPEAWIDIGELDATEQSGPAGPLAGGVPDREVREVLALLAALQFVPKGEHVVADDVLESLAADVTRLDQPKTADSEPFYQARAEGGMVGLVREALVEKPAADGDSAEDEGELRLNDRNDVEGIQGRFQAFEVSTTEVPPPRFQVEQINAEASRVRVAEVYVTMGGGVAEAVTEDSIAENGGSERLPVGDEARERNGSRVAMLEPGDTATNRTLRAAAAAFVFLLYSSRTARSADVKEPEKWWPALRGVSEDSRR